MQKILAATSILLAAGLSTNASWAGERIQVSGVDGYVDQSEILEAGPDRLVIMSKSHNTGYITDDPGSPMHMAAGPCWGLLQIAGSTGEGRWYCVRTDPAGDQFLIIGSMNPDISEGITGTWKLEGLTGKWVGATGAGAWGPILETHWPDRYYADSFNGWIEMAD